MTWPQALALARRPFWSDADHRLRLLWRMVGFGVLIILLERAASAAGLRLDPGEILRGSAPALRLSLIALAVLFAACLAAVRLLDRRSVRELGIVPGPRFWGDLVFGLMVGAATMTLVFAIEYALGWARITAVAYTRAGEAFGPALLRMIGVFACVALYEETASRGYLLRTMAQGFAGRRVPPPWALAIATLVSSAFFALGHVNNPGASVVSTANILCAGVVLALPYVITGRLAASIGFHATWNFFQSTVYGFATSGVPPVASAFLVAQEGPPAWTGGAFGPEAGILGLVGFLLGGAALVLRERWRSGSVTACTALVTGERPSLRAATPGSPSRSPATPAS